LSLKAVDGVLAILGLISRPLILCMTQALDSTVAALQESVRHNEKNIDRLDRHLQAFRAEVLQQFSKVDDRFVQMEQKMDDRFQKVDDRFVQMEQKMDDRFQKVDDRFEKVEASLKQVNNTLLMLSGLIVSGIGILVAALKGVF
jgi:uncharacterized protein (DUF3084 family)